MKKLNQKGFTAIEAILILVIVAIIGGTGFYVYNSNKKSDKTSETTESTIAQSPAPTEAKYLSVKEWRVKFKVSDDTPSGVTYKKKTRVKSMVQVLSSLLFRFLKKVS